jgi:hypothetical protein
MTLRIVNTKDALAGPFGTRYVHDAARPWAVLRTATSGEICIGRFASERLAKAAVRRRVQLIEAGF